MMSEPNPDDWMDISGACVALGKSRPTVYALIDSGALRLYRIGGHRVLWAADVYRVGDAYQVLDKVVNRG